MLEFRALADTAWHAPEQGVHQLIHITIHIGSIKMGRKSAGLFAGLVLVALLAGCVTAAATKKPSVPINKIALATFTVRNWEGVVSGTAGNARGNELISNML